MKLFYSLILLCICSTTISAQNIKTLKECIALGIENNLVLGNARIDVNKGNTGISQSRSRLLPMLDGVFQFTDYFKKPVNVTTGTVLGNDFPDAPTWQVIQSTQYNVNAGVQLSMPIYNQTVFAAIDVAKTVEKLNRLSYEKASDDLIVQISKVYYLAQMSLGQQRLIEENITRMNELCEITDALYQQGVVMEVDVNRVRINLKNLEVQKNQYFTLYEQQLNMLRFLMDISPETPLAVTHMPEIIEPVQTNGISDELPELRLADRQIELIEKRIKTVKTGYIPTVSLFGQIGATGYQEKFHHFFHSRESSQNWFGNYYLGFTVRVPILDGNAKKLQIRQYKYDAQQAENRKILQQKQLDNNYTNTILQLRLNLEMFYTQTDSYRQAEDVYNVTEEKYKEGISSMTELLQDEMRLRETQVACIQAHFQFNLAQLDLLKLSGSLTQLSK